jgi:hypothetical protein
MGLPRRRRLRAFAGGLVLLFLVERTLIFHSLWGTFAIVATSGVAAVVLCVLSMLLSGLTTPPQ